VVNYYAGFQWVSGGFAGVDVFFVISGYLIASIIYSEIKNQKFTLLGFYERRARRILPALFLVTFISIPFAYLFMLPDPLENFGQSIVATTLFSNNVLLTLTSSYWDIASKYKPFLHTWSLGVEEQFYIIFPLLFLTFLKHGTKAISFLLITLAFGSFLFNQLLAYDLIHLLSEEKDNAINFYSIFTRAWELLVGSLIALLIIKRGILSSNFLSLLGIIFIFISYISLNHSDSYPNLYTTLPVIGSAMIIVSTGPKTILAKFLRLKLLTSTGLISYSLYLWHLPIFIFANIASKTELSQMNYIILIFLAIFISYLSWRFIERIFRDRKMVSKRLLLYSLSISSLFLISIGIYFHQTNGLPERVFDSQDSSSRSTHEIKLFSPNKYSKNSFSSKNYKITVFGDSYAHDVSMLIDYYYPNVEIRNVFSSNNNIQCIQLEKVRKNDLTDTDLFIFAFDEGLYTNCTNELISAIENKNKNIIFFGTKHFGNNLNWLSQIPQEKRKLLCQKPNRDFYLIDKIDKEKIPGKNYISLIDVLGGNCVTITNHLGELISSDRKHLTIAGVEFLSVKLFSQINILNSQQVK